MPKTVLTPDFVLHPPPCPKHRIKTDHFDTEIPGFLLEVRRSGKATFYQRYRDAYGRMRQCRIGPTDCISLEEAKKRALRIRAGVFMGVDPLKAAEKRRHVCAFKDVGD